MQKFIGIDNSWNLINKAITFGNLQIKRPCVLQVMISKHVFFLCFAFRYQVTSHESDDDAQCHSNQVAKEITELLFSDYVLYFLCQF